MTPIDWLILAIYLAAVVAVAFWAARRDGSEAGFFLAGRNMPAWAVGLSVMATAFSAVNYVALPTEVATQGLYVLGAMPAFVIVAPFITRIVIPFFRDLNLVSGYGYLERRFDARVGRFASALFLLWRWLWLSAALLALGAVAAHVADLPVLWTIILAGLLATLYSSWGGLRSVMWTDLVQFAVILGSIVLVTMMALQGLPRGLADVIDLAQGDDLLRPLRPFDSAFLSLDPRQRISLPSAVIGTMVMFLARYGADQMMLQRYLAARSLRTAQRGMWLNVAAALLALSLLVGFGLVAHACVRHGLVQALPPREGSLPIGRFIAAVIRAMPPGVTGLVLAGLTAATLSSLDSGINACAASITHDLVRRPSSPRARRTISAVSGIAIILGALLLAALGQDLFELANRVVNALGSPLLALFVLGLFSRRVNSTGMLIGGSVGLIASIGLSLLAKDLALHYYAVGNLLFTIAACMMASRVCGGGSNPQQLAWTWSARRQRKPTL